jgi:hypothetical protein
MATFEFTLGRLDANELDSAKAVFQMSILNVSHCGIERHDLFTMSHFDLTLLVK